MSSALSKNITHWLVLNLGVPLIYGLYRLLGLTWRCTRTGCAPVVFERIGRGERFIVAFFHGDSLLMAHEFQRIVAEGERGSMYLMASRSRDGEIMTRFLKRVGARVCRGSSSRGGGRALLEMRDALGPQDYAGLAVDGPRGPRHEVKEGALLLAQRTGRAVAPVAIRLSSKWTVRSWDRMEFAKPFCRAEIVYGEPLAVPADADAAAIAALRLELENRMKALKGE